MNLNFEKNQMFYSYFKDNIHPMWVFDNDSQAIIDVNQKSSLQYGYSKEEFLQLSINEFLTKLSDPIEENIADKSPENSFNTAIGQLRHKMGWMLYARITHYKIQYNNRSCTLATAFDYREEPGHVGNLQLSVKDHELLSLATLHANNFVLILDKYGLLKWTNQAFTKAMGLGLSEIIGKATSEFLFGNPPFTDNIRQLDVLIKQTKPFSIELLQASRTGNKIWVLVNGNPIFDDKNELKYFILTETDISAQKKNESIIQQSEAELNSFFNNTGSLHILFNKEFVVTVHNIKPEQLAKTILKSNIKKGDSVLLSVPDANKNDFIHFANLAFKGIATTDREIHLPEIDQWWNLKYNPIYDGFGTVIGACFTAFDITDKKQAALDLAVSNERLYWVSKATSDAIWDWEIQNNKLYRGEGYLTLFGLDPNELENNTSDWDDLIHEEDRERVLKDFDQTLSSKASKWVCEYRFKKKNQVYAHVLDKALIIRDASGKPIRVVGAMQDISEQKFREKQLNLFESVITNANDGVIITDVGEPGKLRRKIVYANEAICKMTGYSKDELIGNSPSIFQGAKSDKEELRRFNEKLSNWERAEMEIIDYKRNGEEMWMNISVVPIKDEKGVYSNWISIQKDITKRKKRQLERDQLINHLTKTNRELEQFSYITSHNLRAPLTNLLAISNLIKEDEIEDQRNKNLIQAFKKSTNLLNTTLNDLIRILIIKENPNQEIEELMIENVFSNTILSLSRIIKNAEGKVNYNFKNAPIVSFNRVYLESIFISLLSNSLKFRRKDVPLEINVSSKPTPDGIEIHFQDNGIGMDPMKIKDKIFGLYQKFNDNKKSKGIGLYLVHSQMTSLGGDIQINTNLDVGTTFILIFKLKTA